MPPTRSANALASVLFPDPGNPAIITITGRLCGAGARVVLPFVFSRLDRGRDRARPVLIASATGRGLSNLA
jgi:hypothetical protein